MSFKDLFNIILGRQEPDLSIRNFRNEIAEIKNDADSLRESHNDLCKVVSRTQQQFLECEESLESSREIVDLIRYFMKISDEFRQTYEAHHGTYSNNTGTTSSTQGLATATDSHQQ